MIATLAMRSVRQTKAQNAPQRSVRVNSRRPEMGPKPLLLSIIRLLDDRPQGSSIGAAEGISVRLPLGSFHIGIEVAEVQLVLQIQLNAGRGASDLAGHESLSTSG